MERLAARAQQALGAHVEHDRGMSYASSQQLVLGLTAMGTVVPSLDPSSVAKVVAYVSSKGKLFAILAFEVEKATRAAKEWLPARGEGHHAGLREVVGKLASVLEAEGYHRLSGPALERLAPGHVTEMDGAPARVFDVLFTELV